ncbi:MAG: hypothetical protein GXP25_12795 [Planctomycetes bacterium]|nr:hypothetical protein [Planctomycetota bacterium]
MNTDQLSAERGVRSSGFSSFRIPHSVFRTALAVLCVSAATLLLGCAADNQVGFQPAGHSNRFAVADTMRIGDEGGVDKSVAETNTTTIRGERVSITSIPTPQGFAMSALALLFAFAVFVTDRMMAYRQGLRVVQEAIAEDGPQALIDSIKPRVRAMGRRRKALFDKLLRQMKGR